MPLVMTGPLGSLGPLGPLVGPPSGSLQVGSLRMAENRGRALQASSPGARGNGRGTKRKDLSDVEVIEAD